MGSTLSTTVGYGFTLPYFGDDADEEIAPVSIQKLMEDHDEDSYEVLEALLKDHPGFSFDFPNIYDYYDAPVIFLDNTTRTFYGAHPHEFEPNLPQLHDLVSVEALTRELGGSRPSWFLVTSYG